LTLNFLGTAVLHLLHHRRGDGHSFAEGQQEIPGIARGYVHEISVLAEAEDVLVQNDLYAFGHGSATDNDYGAIRNITTSAVPLMNRRHGLWDLLNKTQMILDRVQYIGG
jgi:hypothetical protein